jgi:hypothetical protein
MFSIGDTVRVEGKVEEITQNKKGFTLLVRFEKGEAFFQSIKIPVTEVIVENTNKEG